MENVLFFLKNNQLAKLKESLMEENPVDIAELFEDLTKEQSLKIFRILPKDTSAEVFSYLSSEKQQEIVENITDEEIRHRQRRRHEPGTD